MAKVTWIGGPTAVVEAKGFRVLIDPVLGDVIDMDGRTIARRTPALVPSNNIDVTLITRVAPDHVDAAGLTAAGNAPVIVPVNSVQLPGGHPAKPLAWHEAWAAERDGVKLTVTATPAHADDDQQPIVGRPVGNGYHVQCGEGEDAFTFYLTGDTLMSDAIRQVQKRHGYVDWLFPYLGGEGTSDAPVSADSKEAMQFVYRMRPNRVLPLHHSTFDHYTEPIDEFREKIELTIYEKKLILLAEGESFER